jgi:hypothetical protein
LPERLLFVCKFPVEKLCIHPHLFFYLWRLFEKPGAKQTTLAELRIFFRPKIRLPFVDLTQEYLFSSAENGIGNIRNCFRTVSKPIPDFTSLPQAGREHFFNLKGYGATPPDDKLNRPEDDSDCNGTRCST